MSLSFTSFTKKWILLSVGVFVFLTIVVMFDFVSLPLWLLLGGVTTEAGRRLMLTKISFNSTTAKLINKIEFSFNADVMEKINKEDDEVKTVDENVKIDSHNNKPQPPDGLTSEVEKYIKIIMKEYICSWYNNLSNDDQFPSEIEYALEDLIVAFMSRVRQIHSRHLTTKVLKVYHKYFQQFVTAKKQGQRLEDVFTDYHYALESGTTENQHISNVVNVLLEVLVPADILCCPTGRHLVVSLLANQVIRRLVNLISDPKFINRCILLLIGLDPDVSNGQSRSNSCPSDCATSAVHNDHRLSSCNSRFDSDEKLDLETGAASDYMNCIWQRLADDSPSSFKVERQQEVNEMLLNSQKHKSTKLPKSSSFDRISDLFPSNLSLEYISNYVTQNFRSSPGKDSNDSEILNDEVEETELPCQSDSQNSAETNTSGFQVKSGLQGLLSVTTGPVLCETLPNVCHSKEYLNTKKTLPFEIEAGESEKQAEEAARAASSSAHDALDIDELFNSQENPFVKLEITTAEVMEGVRPGSQYAIYCIQYDAWFFDTDNIKTVDLGNYIDVLKPKSSLQSVTVRRRFREFVTLHSRLEDKLKSHQFFKSLKGPNKWSIIPFGKLDRDTIETRRKFLENYLQTLVSNPEAVKCKCLREFLAYGTDDTTFERKPNDIGQFVPRLDKLLMKKMTGVFDKLKTALPNLPSEPFTTVGVTSLQTPSPGESSSKAADRFLGYFNITPTGNQDGVSTTLLFEYCTEEELSSSLENRIGRFLSTGDSNHDKIDIAFDAGEMDKWTNDPWSNTPNLLNEQSMNSVDVNTRLQPIENDEIGDQVLNLLFEAFDDGSIFKRDRFVHTTKTVLGETLNDYLIDVIDSCTTEQAFVGYLQLIREKLWPTNFHLKIAYKSSSHYYEMARQQLSNCIPGIAKTAIGRDQVDKIIRLFLDSFQSPKLLRHLVYCLLDVLVDDLLVKSRRQSILERLG
ncbi:Sorting nexin-19 [Chamberlinius hualienensis]